MGASVLDRTLEAPMLSGLLSDASQSQLMVFLYEIDNGAGIDGWVLTKLVGAKSRHTGESFVEYAVHRVSYENTYLIYGSYFNDYVDAVRCFMRNLERVTLPKFALKTKEVSA
jgi:hypothetical protein